MGHNFDFWLPINGGLNETISKNIRETWWLVSLFFAQNLQVSCWTMPHWWWILVEMSHSFPFWVDVSPMEDHHISWSNHVKSRGFLRKSSSSMRDFPASQCPLVPILSIINHYNEEPQYVYNICICICI